MWLTVLVLACVATADPLRIGVGVALSSRRQAVGPLAAFWLGGMAVSAVLAAVVLFGVRDTALATMHRMQVATASATAGHIQIGMGVVALLIAGAGVAPRQRSRLGISDSHGSALQLRTAATMSRLSHRAQDALQARPIRMSFTLGVGMLVDFRYLGALTAIVTSGVAMGTQISAAGAYSLIALAFVELPLVSRLAAPAKTDRMMSAVNKWAKARRQQVFALVIGVLGVFLMTRGLDHI
ncbi:MULTISPECIES: GAP family protein [Mycobacterium]|uniref:GAP family protein n=1 Tax=Mycobacterium TaxID=1763 RepID=UPI000A7D49DD|nr:MULTISPECIES: GAP family protein [Mycobacterium]MBX9978736.1 GAP family protein [Mycobacterium gordonae]MCQ4362138.1 GAP family protein [Mycobacterium gordonae]MCV7004567.1 GAP family protein [Mycobacterium gordonae]